MDADDVHHLRDHPLAHDLLTGRHALDVGFERRGDDIAQRGRVRGAVEAEASVRLDRRRNRHVDHRCSPHRHGRSDRRLAGAARCGRIERRLKRGDHGVGDRPALGGKRDHSTSGPVPDRDHGHPADARMLAGPDLVVAHRPRAAALVRAQELLDQPFVGLGVRPADDRLLIRNARDRRNRAEQVDHGTSRTSGSPRLDRLNRDRHTQAGRVLGRRMARAVHRERAVVGVDARGRLLDQEVVGAAGVQGSIDAIAGSAGGAVQSTLIVKFTEAAVVALTSVEGGDSPSAVSVVTT